MGGSGGTGGESRGSRNVGMSPFNATVSLIAHERGCGDFEPAVADRSGFCHGYRPRRPGLHGPSVSSRQRPLLLSPCRGHLRPASADPRSTGHQSFGHTAGLSPVRR